jgi:putative ABC transport system substrate-binding protein
MRRREFIAALGGAVAWSSMARAQQSEQMRRIGVLISLAADDPQRQALTAFQQALQQLGWIDGRNVRIDTRWGENDVDRDRRYAEELVALAPDVILTSGTLGVAALQRVTRTLPIVFIRVTDPVGAGVVDTLARPGGNTTGFMNFEYSLSGKWLEILKQIAPQLRERLFFGIPLILQRLLSLAPSRPQRSRSGWMCARSACATPAKSNAPLRPSPNPRMAA